ncbi:MAG: DNA mismatch repair endonuclease MutL [Deferrisomatales bacterium]|nr:DNA mismatch repair endonuclease MutL [Deferrisomatales bacterium]
MARIRVLPDEVANRIAAGEVVERPASVVKELVENAVDAGGRRVRVRVEGAGRRAISVEDDGCGMGRDDALLALERHATSKLAAAEDLERIGTLGFRGEALPSIASVSRLRLLTRAEGDPEGTEVRLEGGRLVSVETRGAARGTWVEAEDLFYNVPARRKFLKGDATELRNVVETLTQLSLAHCGVGFELRSGNRVLLALPPDQSLEDRAAEVVGAEAPAGLRWAQGEADGWGFTLAFGAPHEGRGHRRGMRLFVNGRPVQDRLLFRALLEGYRGLLETARFPVALLWLRLPPEEVDVNVHPAKREVRFRDESRVFRWVAGRTAQALAEGAWAGPGRRREPGCETVGEEPPVGGSGTPPSWGRAAGEGAPPPGRGRDAPAATRVAEALQDYARRAEARGMAPRPPPPFGSFRTVSGGAGAGGGSRHDDGVPGEGVPVDAGTGAGPFRGLRYLGAFDATYLLFEDPGSRELVLLDQHAAHERVLYEALLDDAAGRPGAPKTQTLLLPVTLECSPGELAGWEERRDALAALGFRTEAFGPAAVAVREAPAGLPVEAVEAAVRDLLGAEAAAWGGVPGFEEGGRREALARRAACAAAVKARACLDPSEVGELLARLETLRHPTHCPHGRPLLVRLTRRQVEGMFHRG